MAELLFEILSEEMPAGVQEWASNQLQTEICNRLWAAGLSFIPRASDYLTARRIVIWITEVSVMRPDRTEERKGPKVGAPEQAVQGFLRSAGLSSLDEAENRDGVYFAVKRIPGGPTADLLPGLLIDAMLALRWPKSMRWRDTRLTWVRPIRNLLGIFDGKVLAGGLHLGHAVEGGRQAGFATVEEGGDDQNFLPFNGLTYGHRFLAPQKIEVASFADYQRKLEAAKVVLDADARKAIIKKGIADKAASLGLTAIDDPRLLDEVAGLVEWPVPLIGKIDDQFLDLPPEVLTTSMRTHQKYFALAGSDGRVSHFAVVANVTAEDGGKAIVAGNERVLRARLSDARFFWDQDRKAPLEAFAKKLDARVFHAKLGTVADKVERVAALAREIAAHLPHPPPPRGRAGVGGMSEPTGESPVAADHPPTPTLPLEGGGSLADMAERAARLAKADLSSGMVGEFPELQGVMGRYYALEQGEPLEIADAIRDHYKPQGPSDAVPTAPVSIAVALADKIDTLREFFRINEKPTGSKDPFALRRAALGLIRIMLENRLDFSLGGLFLIAPAKNASLEQTASAFAAAEELIEFVSERLAVYLRDQGLRLDAVRAALQVSAKLNPLRALSRARSIEQFVGSETGANLLAGFRRASNIVKIEQERDGTPFDAFPDGEQMVSESEKALLKHLVESKQRVAAAIADGAFDDAIVALSQLRAPVDAFFENVTVNDPDPELRINRLRLLNQLRDIFLKVADFSVIEG